jgi:hypothetical protein
MDKEKKQPAGQSSTWMWLSADGTRWRIHHTTDGIWSCPIGTGGKRVGSWEPGLPSSLGAWPGPKNHE